MPENTKTIEFLQKLTPCIDRGDLDACVEEAARVAQEMGVGAQKLVLLSAEEGMNDRYDFVYVLNLTAARGLEGDAKAEANYNVGTAAHHLRKVEKAEEHYKLAIDAKPKYAQAHSNYALLLSELNRKPEAEEQYKLAIAANPNYVEAHKNYAKLLREKAMFSDAENEVRIALKDSMEQHAKSKIHNNLGWVYVHLEQYNRAKKEFNEAHKLDPQNVKVIRNIRALHKVKSEPKISRMQWTSSASSKLVQLNSKKAMSTGASHQRRSQRLSVNP